MTTISSDIVNNRITVSRLENERGTEAIHFPLTELSFGERQSFRTNLKLTTGNNIVNLTQGETIPNNKFINIAYSDYSFNEDPEIREQELMDTRFKLKALMDNLGTGKLWLNNGWYCNVIANRRPNTSRRSSDVINQRVEITLVQMSNWTNPNENIYSRQLEMYNLTTPVAEKAIYCYVRNDGNQKIYPRLEFLGDQIFGVSSGPSSYTEQTGFSVYNVAQLNEIKTPNINGDFENELENWELNTGDYVQLTQDHVYMGRQALLIPPSTIIKRDNIDLKKSEFIVELNYIGDVQVDICNHDTQQIQSHFQQANDTVRGAPDEINPLTTWQQLKFTCGNMSDYPIRMLIKNNSSTENLYVDNIRITPVGSSVSTFLMNPTNTSGYNNYTPANGVNGSLAVNQQRLDILNQRTGTVLVAYRKRTTSPALPNNAELLQIGARNRQDQPDITVYLNPSLGTQQIILQGWNYAARRSETKGDFSLANNPLPVNDIFLIGFTYRSTTTTNVIPIYGIPIVYWKDLNFHSFNHLSVSETSKFFQFALNDFSDLKISVGQGGSPDMEVLWMSIGDGFMYNVEDVKWDKLLKRNVNINDFPREMNMKLIANSFRRTTTTGKWMDGLKIENKTNGTELEIKADLNNQATTKEKITINCDPLNIDFNRSSPESDRQVAALSNIEYKSDNILALDPGVNVLRITDTRDTIPAQDVLKAFMQIKYNEEYA